MIAESVANKSLTNTSRILTDSLLYPEDLIEVEIIPSEEALDNNYELE